MGKYSVSIQEYIISKDIMNMKGFCEYKDINYSNFRVAYSRYKSIQARNPNVTNVTNVTSMQHATSGVPEINISFQEYISTRTTSKILLNFAHNRHLINEMFRLVTEYNRNK